MGQCSSQKRSLCILDEAIIVLLFIELLRAEIEDGQNHVESGFCCFHVVAVRAFAWSVINHEFLGVCLAFKPNGNVLVCIKTEDLFVLVWTKIICEFWSKINDFLACTPAMFDFSSRPLNCRGFNVIDPALKVSAKLSYFVDVRRRSNIYHIIEGEGKVKLELFNLCFLTNLH